jgi:hypothetical protein
MSSELRPVIPGVGNAERIDIEVSEQLKGIHQMAY